MCKLDPLRALEDLRILKLGDSSSPFTPFTSPFIIFSFLSGLTFTLGGVRLEALVDLGDKGDLEVLLETGEGDLFLFILALKFEQKSNTFGSDFFFVLRAKTIDVSKKCVGNNINQS